jgi:predicted  nucleic acid-binding Zn-ribbon protein
MVRADPAALERLVELQAEDSAIDRLGARRAGLPEAARLAELKDQLAELDADIAIATKQADELGREAARIEDETATLEARIAKDEERLFSGKVANPKELSNLQADVEMLKRKRAEQEDALLEVMVKRDTVAENLAKLSAERDQMAAEAGELEATVGALIAEIDAELEQRRAARAGLAGALPDDLLALYESLRASKHGVGVAVLEGATCSGCHTKLPAKEVERLKAEKGLQRCDNCRRILVVR